MRSMQTGNYVFTFQHQATVSYAIADCRSLNGVGLAMSLHGNRCREGGVAELGDYKSDVSLSDLEHRRRRDEGNCK